MDLTWGGAILSCDQWHSWVSEMVRRLDWQLVWRLRRWDLHEPRDQAVNFSTKHDSHPAKMSFTSIVKYLKTLNSQCVYITFIVANDFLT